jgi:hypothetical protein
MARRWSQKAAQEIFDGVGTYGVAWFQKRSGKPYDWPQAPQQRSHDAIRAKARRLYGRGGLRRGSYSMSRLRRETGYTYHQLTRAQVALRQKWRRTKSNGSYLITDEQVEEILEWLKHDYWSGRSRTYCCLWCATTKGRPKSSGLCGACFSKYWRLCVKKGLPTSLVGMTKLVQKFKRRAFPKTGEHVKFLEAMLFNLSSRRALSFEELEYLERLVVDELQ